MLCGRRVGDSEPERHDEAGADVVAQHQRAQQARAVAVRQLGRRQRRRNDRAAGMEAAAGVRIVGLVGVRAHAVGERRIDRRGDDPAAHHRGLPAAALRAHIRDRPSPGRQPRARHHGGERIQEVALRLLRDLLGQRLRQRRRDVFAELAGDRGDATGHARIWRRAHPGGRLPRTGEICHRSLPLPTKCRRFMPDPAG